MRGVLQYTVIFLAHWGAAMGALALEVGDTVVVIRPADLEPPGGRVVTLVPGTSVVVRAIDGERLTVEEGRTGRLARSSVIPLGEAVAYFSAAIAKDPRDAAALTARGQVWLDRGDLDKAIADLDESLRLEPSSSMAHTTRGWAWKRKGDKDRAMSDFDRAIALDAKNALAWRVRGATWASRKDYPKARAHYTESIRIDPDNPDSLHHRALLLAACTEAQYRDGKQAVADATRACEISGWNNPLYLNGLAAASAEAGDFKAAVEWQTKAMERVPAGQKKAMQARVEQYQQHQPFRMTWR